jgi:nucleotide-binding universal stress UspA family protein
MSMLLVPTDFGDSSKLAFDRAVALAQRLSAEVVLLNVWDLPVVAPEGALVVTPEWAERIVEATQKALGVEAARHAKSGVKITTMSRQGDAWRTILDVAAELHPEMILMGTHGRRGLPRALLGSVAEKVVRTAECSVLTVRAPEPA